MKKFLPRTDEQGFSLIELVVVVAVLAILAAIGIPSFNAIIKQALLAITKTSLIDNYKQCKMNSDGEINLSNIPGVVFQSNDCASDITATINSECTLKMNMSTGAKTGWTDSYDECTKILSKDEQLHNDYREGADEMIARYNISDGNCPTCNNGMLMGDPMLDPEDELYDMAVPIYDPDTFQSNLHMMKAAGLTCESKFIGSNWQTSNNAEAYETGNYENVASGYVLIKGSSQEEFRLNAKKMGLRPVNFDVQGERQFLQDHYGRNPDHDNNQDCQIAEVKFDTWDYENNTRYWRENKP